MPEQTSLLNVGKRFIWASSFTGIGHQKGTKLPFDTTLQWVAGCQLVAWATWANVADERLKEHPSKWSKTAKRSRLDHGVGRQQKPIARVPEKVWTIANWNPASDQLAEGAISVSSLTSLLRGYAKAKALSNGRRVHAYIVFSGYDLNLFLGNCLVHIYGNCRKVEDARAVFDSLPKPNLFSWNILINAYGQSGNLDDARSLFDRMPNRDVVSWNAMIAACVQNRHYNEALALFQHMWSEGVPANVITFVSALDACTSLTAIKEGQEVHTAIVCSWGQEDVIVGNALINMYGKFGYVQDAKSVFCRMHDRNVVSWTAMIAALGQNGNGKEALDAFHAMKLKGIKPDKITYVCALDACASVSAHEQGQELHSAILDSGAEQDVIVATALVNMYAKCGTLDDARNVFSRMPLRNVVSWTAMIAAFAQNAHGEEALDLFYAMQFEGINPNNITFAFAVDACASLTSLLQGQEIHAAIVDRGVECDIAVATALINMYGKCRSTRDAMIVFAGMPYRNVVSWSTMIAAFAQNGFGKEALSLFHQMQAERLYPNNMTFVCLVDACTSLTALEEGRAIHGALADSGLEQDVFVGNALVHMYGKCGSLVEAKTVFDQMPHRSIVSWTAMIAAFALNGHGKDAVALFQQMLVEGIKPDSVTFTCVLNACSHTGLVDLGRQFFFSMYEDHGIPWTMDHYVCMIDLLGRAGHLDEAEDLIKNMPFGRMAVPWLCLLGACRSHGDLERGLRAANHLFELDPRNATPFVVLSNMFAAAGMPDVANIEKWFEEEDLLQVMV